MHHFNKFLPRLLIVLLFGAFFACPTLAAEKNEKATATNTVTGTVTVQDVKTAIEKGKFKDGQLTFEIPREYGGVKFTSRYAGKLTGDTLKGKIISGTAPVERTYEWNAKRAKPDAKP